MVNRTVKRLKQELLDTEKQNALIREDRATTERQLAAKIAEVELLQESNRETRNMLSNNYRDLTDQVVWMRNLIEALTIDPKVIYAKTDRDSRMRNQERKDYREERVRRSIEDRKYMNVAKASAMDSICSCDMCRGRGTGAAGGPAIDLKKLRY